MNNNLYIKTKTGNHEIVSSIYDAMNLVSEYISEDLTNYIMDYVESKRGLAADLHDCISAIEEIEGSLNCNVADLASIYNRLSTLTRVVQISR